MIAIFKREIRNYLKRPLFWVGVLLVIYGVFNATSPYLTTHYLTTGEEIINDQSNTSVEGEVYEGYIPATPEKHREVWHEKVKIKLTDVFGLTDSEAQNVIEKLESMNLKEAYAYLEQEYDWYGARYLYEDSTYYKGTAEEINAYLDKKLEDKTFSFYYARKFADFAGLYMVFFAIIMLAVLFLQDTKKNYYLYFITDTKKADLKLLRDQINSTRLSFASEEKLYEMLKLTKGSVTPLGVVNDESNKVIVLLDKDNKDTNVLLHPQFNTTTLSIKYSDLIRFIEYCGNKYIEV